MTTQNSYRLATPKSRPTNGRRPPEKSITLSATLLGTACVITLFTILALLFHAG
jgi:hypothetical protein